MDQKDLVDGLSVTNNGDKSFVNFHVSAANIKMVMLLSLLRVLMVLLCGAGIFGSTIAMR